MKPKEIRQKIQDLWENGYYDRGRIAYALAMTLPDDELLDMVADFFYNKGIRTVIGRNRDGSPRYSMFVGIIQRRGLEHRLWRRQRKPILATMEELSSDSCKRKGFLRERLKNWYYIANESYRKRIALFMLNQPTKKERQWAYSRIMTQWDDAYRDAVACAFEKFNDDNAAGVILNHFPSEYIYRHRERLSELKGDGWVYSLVGKDHPEVVCLERLSPSQRVRVIRSLDLRDRADEVEDMLYKSIASEVAYILSRGDMDTTDLCFDRDKGRTYAIRDLYTDFFCYYYTTEWSAKDGYYLPRYFELKGEEFFGYAINLFGFNGVASVIRAMGSLGMADALVRFERLNSFLQCTAEDKESLPLNMMEWLQKVYRLINVNMLGYAPLPEKYSSLLSWEELQSMAHPASRENSEDLTDDDECLDLPF